MSFADRLCARHPDLFRDCIRTVRICAPDETGLIIVVDETAQVLVDDGRAVDIHLTLDAYQVEAVLAADASAATHLLAALFWPVTWWSLRRRRARDWVLQLGLEVDNVLHFSLPFGSFTAVHVNSEWLWASGHHAIASLHFTLSTDEMHEWLTNAVRATTSKNDLYWQWLTPWYTAFRNRTAQYTTNETRQERLLSEFAAYDHWDEADEAWPGWEGW
jgi:hypothetical protein